MWSSTRCPTRPTAGCAPPSTASSSGLCGVSALAIEPPTRAAFWVAPSALGARFRGHFIGDDGAPDSEVIEVGSVCNPFTVSLGAVWPRADRRYTIGESEDCVGHSALRVTRIEADNRTTPYSQPSDRAFCGFVAYDGLTHRMHTFAPRLTAAYDEMYCAALDLGAGTFTPPVRVQNPSSMKQHKPRWLSCP